MNIFDKKLKAAAKPDLPIAPIELYQTCPYKENYGYLRGIQEEVLRAWHLARDQRDVICKMNTGSGKTLTGLIMLYSKLVEKVGPSIYLCPDKQLLDQTIELAGLYGIPVCKFEDGSNNFPADFINGKSILITTFHKLFNGKSIFTKNNIQIGALLLDDAHKCMDIARENSTIKVARNHFISKKLFALFSDALKHQLPGTFYRLEGQDPTILMKVPYWAWMDYHDEVIKIINEYIDSISNDFENNEDIKFVWPLVSDNILSYDCYFNGNDMEISPIHVPYHEVPPFNEAKFRYILSATFEDDYDLIKDLGISAKSVLNPIVPADRKDVGKRLILAPSRFDSSLNSEVSREFIANYPKKGYNTVVLVPSAAKAAIWKDLGATIIDRNNITKAIDKLSKSKGNFFVFVNRYDGIDLYNDLCRILVLDGLPRYNSIKEQYEETRLETLSAGKKAQIIEQGLGRATRSGGDYSVVYIIGDDLVNFLGYEKNLKHFTPLTKAQLSLGLELLDGESSDNPLKTIDDTAAFCLNQHPSWHQVHTQALISSEKEGLNDEKKRKIELAVIENNALEKFKRRKYTEAANIILDEVVNEGDIVKKEKAWYYQMAAQLMYLDHKVESNNLQNKACDITTQMFHPFDTHIYKKIKSKGVQGANVRKVIEGFSTSQDVVLYVKELINSLQYNPDIKAQRFETGLAKLGRFLGFSAQMPEKELGNGPDVLWCMTDGIYLILEAKSRSIHEEITRDNIGQLLISEEWFKEQYPDKQDDYLAVTLQATNKKGDNVNVSTQTRVLDLSSLEKLHGSLRFFANALQGKLNNSHTDDEINKLLAAYNLTPDLFVKTYLKGIKK
jgi:replicative superfamily II helicase